MNGVRSEPLFARGCLALSRERAYCRYEQLSFSVLHTGPEARDVIASDHRHGLHGDHSPGVVLAVDEMDGRG